jgi:hypothetical protein
MSNRRDNNRGWNIHYYGAKRQPNGSYILPDSGTIHWYNDEGDFHRTDGPAVTRLNGCSSWYLNGNRYPFKEWLPRTPIPDEQKLLLRLQYG